MTQDLETLYREDPVKACTLAIQETKDLPEHERLEKMNHLLRGYGLEAIRGEWQNGYWCDVVACYINMGDTYAVTVIHVRGDYNGASGSFLVRSWGDFVEKNSKKYGII